MKKEDGVRAGQSEEMRWTGGRNGHEEVLCLVKVKEQGRLRGRGMRAERDERVLLPE